MKKILQDLTFSQIEELTLALGEKKFRAKQLFEGLTQGKTIDGITPLSKDFKEKLKAEFENEPIKIRERYLSSDGTEKYLFEYADGNLVEGVLMKYKYGYTLCVSTQVGCRMGCAFCATGIDGLARNLRPSEMLGQIYQIQKISGERVSNVVVMGTGEPMDNYDNFVKFVRMLSKYFYITKLIITLTIDFI